MLRVTITQVRDDGQTRFVAEMHIRRDGMSSTQELGVYDVYFSQLFKPLAAARAWRHIRLEGYQRWRHSSPFHLLAACLKQFAELINGHGTGPKRERTVD